MTPLPVHPFTGLTAIGVRRDGRPIYPIRGGSEPPADPAPAPQADPPAPAPSPPAPAPPAQDEPLGPAGKKALDAERARVKELERQMAALAPLQQLASAMAGEQPAGGPSEVELLQQRFAELERTANDERAARWRIEVAQAKSLTADQAAWLQGSTQEELLASADRLLAAFPAGPRTPAPDPSQGARGGQPSPDLQAQIDAARGAGDFRKAISLERQKLQNVPRPT